MKTELECIPCYLKQTFTVLDLIPDIDENTRIEATRAILDFMSDMPFDVSPSINGSSLHRLLQKILGIPDPFASEKDKHTKMALEFLPELQRRVSESDDPLVESVRMAIAGNIIDYGTGQAAGSVDVAGVMESMEFAREELKLLAEMLGDAKNVLYLADNAGEIVFDRPLIDFIRSASKRIRVAVKSGPIINDATMEDAIASGIDPEILIETGSNEVGTVLAASSKEFRKEFADADLIIAKGQGQFETLHESKRPIFFLLKAKCAVVAKALKVEQGGMVALPVDKV